MERIIMNDSIMQRAKEGDAKYQCQVGLYYQFETDGNMAEAARWYTLAAEQGDPIAQHNLATLYNLGLGVPRNKEQEKYWHTKAAAQGFQPSIEKLGGSSRGSSGGCYIATCVYGSYDCPEVWTLRNFRDNTLKDTWLGRMFIQAYYATSPKIVKIFGNNKLFKKWCKSILDKLIARLERQ